MVINALLIKMSVKSIEKDVKTDVRRLLMFEYEKKLNNIIKYCYKTEALCMIINPVEFNNLIKSSSILLKET